jgi:hypothetical protein
MESAFAWLLALVAALTLFDAASFLFGTDSRDADFDNHRR